MNQSKPYTLLDWAANFAIGSPTADKLFADADSVLASSPFLGLPAPLHRLNAAWKETVCMKFRFLDLP